MKGGTQMPLLASEPSIGLVAGLGMGMVFVGLVCIIIICYLLGAVIRLLKKNSNEDEKPESRPVVSAPAPAVSSQAQISNKQEFVAAVSAAIAEELGTDVSAIRIKSIKKL